LSTLGNSRLKELKTMPLKTLKAFMYLGTFLIRKIKLFSLSIQSEGFVNKFVSGMIIKPFGLANKKNYL